MWDGYNNASLCFWDLFVYYLKNTLLLIRNLMLLFFQMTTNVLSEMFAEMELVQMWKADLNVLVKMVMPLEPCRY